MGRLTELLVRKLKHAAKCGRRFTAGAARVGMSYAVVTRFSSGAGKTGRIFLSPLSSGLLGSCGKLCPSFLNPARCNQLCRKQCQAALCFVDIC